MEARLFKGLEQQKGPGATGDILPTQADASNPIAGRESTRQTAKHRTHNPDHIEIFIRTIHGQGWQ